MVYPYPHRNRVKCEEIINALITGECSAGTFIFTDSTPAGAWAIGWSFRVTNNDKPVVLTAIPWVDKEQTVVSDTSFKFLKTGSTVVTTNITMAATATGDVGSTGVVIAGGDQYGAAAPIITVHGQFITIATTATTGTWELSYTAVEF